MPIDISEQITIPDTELRFQFYHGSGPGGQHVNKAATGVRLFFNVRDSPSLPEPVRRRLLVLAKTYLNSEGMLAITSHRFREQERNRGDAINKMVALMVSATLKPKYRVATRPSRNAKQKRLNAKSKRSSTKKLRRKATDDD